MLDLFYQSCDVADAIRMTCDTRVTIAVIMSIAAVVYVDCREIKIPLTAYNIVLLRVLALITQVYCEKCRVVGLLTGNRIIFYVCII